MAITSYFYDSVNGDRPYSATDFAKAFGMAFDDGVLKNDNGELGFEIGGINYTSIYEGRAMVKGHFIEVLGFESLVVPSGSYAGQVVIQMDAEESRTASIIVKQDRTPRTTPTFYELPLYDVTVTNGTIVGVSDVRNQGGAVPNEHNHNISDVSGLETHINKAITWVADPNGIKAYMGKFAGTGKPVVMYLTSGQPSASSTEHRVWIQIDKF